MRKKKWVIAILTLLIVVFAVLSFLRLGAKKTAGFEFETSLSIAGDISTSVTATGTLEPVKQIEVGTQVSGTVDKIYVDYNSVVKKGDLIAELDKSNLQTAVNEIKAGLNNALNERNYLQKIYDRQKKLFNSGTISESELDESEYKLNNAKNIVVQQQTNLKKAETNLSYANIYSPIDGVVLSKAVNVGQTVAASFNTPTLFTIAQDLGSMQVTANVDEADIGNVKSGQHVMFTVDAFPDDSFAGVVTQIRLNATINSSVVTYSVIIKAENPEKKLMPGMTATVTIFTQMKKNTVKVENKVLALIPDQNFFHIAGKNANEKYNTLKSEISDLGNNAMEFKIVWVLKNKTLYPKRIRTGISDGAYTEILEGLSENEILVSALKEVVENTEKHEAEKSPFMPSPPGSKKK